MVLFPIFFIGKTTSWKKYQYGTFSLGKSTILHLILFLTGTFSYTPLRKTERVSDEIMKLPQCKVGIVNWWDLLSEGASTLRVSY